MIVLFFKYYDCIVSDGMYEIKTTLIHDTQINFQSVDKLTYAFVWRSKLLLDIISGHPLFSAVYSHWKRIQVKKLKIRCLNKKLFFLFFWFIFFGRKANTFIRTSRGLCLFVWINTILFAWPIRLSNESILTCYARNISLHKKVCVCKFDINVSNRCTIKEAKHRWELPWQEFYMSLCCCWNHRQLFYKTISGNNCAFFKF